MLGVEELKRSRSLGVEGLRDCGFGGLGIKRGLGVDMSEVCVA